jgi:trehalose 6-phosphate phosphatase
MGATLDRSGHMAELLAPLIAHPAETAVFSDLDGTLAPIAPTPDEAAVPGRAGELLAALAERYALSGCASGRRAAQVREMVGVDGLCYIGIHGFERLLPGELEASPDPALHEHGGAAHGFVEHLGERGLAAAGLRLEDKGAIQALHWRGAPDEAAAEARAREIAADAAGRNLVPHWGRKVLEVRPPVAIDKGTAIAELLEARRLAHCLYAGDDRTDVDAFTVLREMRDAGDLRTAVCVGICSDESPREVCEEADVVLNSPGELLAVFELLLR